MLEVGVDEGAWVLGGGAGPEWRAACRARTEAALASLRRARSLLRRAPRALAGWGLERSVDGLLRGASAERDRLLAHPAFDAWSALTDTFSAGRPAGDWEAHFPFLQSFSAARALLERGRVRLKARLTREARFHLTGTREYFEFPRRLAGAEALCEVAGGRARVSAGGAAGARRLLEDAGGFWVEHLDPLVLQPVSVHLPDDPSPAARARYARVIARAAGNIRRLYPELHAEMAEFLRVLVPLKNPAGHGSVSSSYQNLRGALCLSHSEDSLLQEETLVHEFSHQKINLLLQSKALLEPGQSAQVFYSPLRPDARRLQGLLLGAHAFLNVDHYLLRALARGGFSAAQRRSICLNIHRRTIQVEQMLRTLSGYASATPLGARLIGRMWRELMLHYHESLAFPKDAVAEAERLCREHRAAHALGPTGLHGRKGAER